MRPQDELNMLKGFIELSPEDATKRNNLESFLSERSKVLIIDADSMLYNVVYAHNDKVFNIDQQLADYLKQSQNVVDMAESEGFTITNVEHHFTTCTNNFRKEIYPAYKGKRTYNEMAKLVSMLKTFVIQSFKRDGITVLHSDTLEADDSVAIRSKELGDRCIIVAIDKDLRQLKGCHFNYQRVNVKDESGSVIQEYVKHDIYGKAIFRPKKEYKGWSFTTVQEGYELLLCQLLIGDAADNITGVKGVGEKGAPKLLKGKNNFGMLRAVYQKYKDVERLRLNIKLMKL